MENGLTRIVKAFSNLFMQEDVVLRIEIFISKYLGVKD